MKDEHLKTRWKIGYSDGGVAIITDEDLPWFICKMSQSINGDEDGMKSATRICEVHNKALEENR